MGYVLVVEDEPGNQATIGLILERGGWNVLTAGTVREALAESQGNPVELCVVDIVLPGASGTEFAARIREAQPHVPILFISGTPIEFWGPSDRENLSRLARGSYSFLPKPFTCGMLRQKVAELLPRRQVRSAA